MVNVFKYNDTISDGFHNHTVVVYDHYVAENTSDSEIINNFIVPTSE